MAEVRKRVLEDKYDTSSIKRKEIKKETNKKKVEKSSKKKKESNEKKSLFTKFMIFWNGVKSEFKKIHWTQKKDLIKYSVATVSMIIFCSLFFYLIDVLFALIQSLVG